MLYGLSRCDEKGWVLQNTLRGSLSGMLICGVSSNLTGKAFDLYNSGQETKCGEMCVVRSNDLYELTETCGPI